jgi:hypothetical protein
VRVLPTLCAFIVFLLASPAVARADPINLPTNGGFETGSFAGWTVTVVWYSDRYNQPPPGQSPPMADNALQVWWGSRQLADV